MDWLWTPVVAGTFALIGFLIGARNEHRQWLRNQRQIAYAEFLKEIDAYVTVMRAQALGGPAPQDDRLVPWADASANMSIVGPSIVTRRAGELVTLILNEQHDYARAGQVQIDFNIIPGARELFLVHARDALKVSTIRERLNRAVRMRRK
jgi:hypothetical protein